MIYTKQHSFNFVKINAKLSLRLHVHKNTMACGRRFQLDRQYYTHNTKRRSLVILKRMLQKFSNKYFLMVAVSGSQKNDCMDIVITITCLQSKTNKTYFFTDENIHGYPNNKCLLFPGDFIKAKFVSAFIKSP